MVPAFFWIFSPPWVPFPLPPHTPPVFFARFLPPLPFYTNFKQIFYGLQKQSNTVGTQAFIQLLALHVYPPVTRLKMHYSYHNVLFMSSSTLNFKKLHINNDCTAI